MNDSLKKRDKNMSLLASYRSCNLEEESILDKFRFIFFKILFRILKERFSAINKSSGLKMKQQMVNKMEA